MSVYVRVCNDDAVHCMIEVDKETLGPVVTCIDQKLCYIVQESGRVLAKLIYAHHL